jgi:hypothetical protein
MDSTNVIMPPSPALSPDTSITTRRRSAKKEYQKKDPNALITPNFHNISRAKPKRWTSLTGSRPSLTGSRRGSNDSFNDSCDSIGMEELLVTPKRHPSSLSKIGNGSLGQSFRSMLKTKKNSTDSPAGHCDDGDDDKSINDGHQDDTDCDQFSGDYLYTLKPQSDHNKPKKRWNSSRRGSNDSFNDSCDSIGIEELPVTQHKRHPSSLSSLGNSLGQSFRSMLKTKKNSTDCDEDESLSDGHEDDSDYDQFSGDYACSNDIDQDKLMEILCKELEITCDGEGE